MATDWSQFESVDSGGNTAVASPPVAPPQAGPDWSQFEALPPADQLQGGDENAQEAGVGDILKAALGWAGGVARGDDSTPALPTGMHRVQHPLIAPELPPAEPQTETMESDIVAPIEKGIGDAVSTVGNIPANVYNAGSAMTKAYPPIPLPFQTGKSVLPQSLIDAAKDAASDEFGTGASGDLAQAAANVTGKTLEGMTTPEGLGQLPFLESKLGRVAVLALNASQTPEQVQQTVKTFKDPDATRAEKWAALGNTGVNLAMTAGLALSLKPGQVSAELTPEEAAKVVEPPQPPNPNEQTQVNDQTGRAPQPPESSQQGSAPEQKSPAENAQSPLAVKPAASPPAIGDALVAKATDAVRAQGGASVSLLQRRLNLGYQQASDLLNELEKRGVVGPARGTQAREILTQPQEPNASQIQEATEVHGDVRPQSGQRESQVPAQESSAGVQPNPVPNAQAPQSEVALKPAVAIAEHPLDKPFKKGFTQDALKFGASLDPAHPEILARLKELEEKARGELHNIPKDLEHFQQLSVAGSKKQWLTEAIQAAEGLDERDAARELLGPDYKPPFPTEKLREGELTSQSTKPETLTPANVETEADVPAAKKAQPLGSGTKFDGKAAREQKKFLLDAIDQAIKEAPESVPRNEHDAVLDRLETQGSKPEYYAQYGVKETDTFDNLKQAVRQASFKSKPKVTIKVPGDGEFDIIHSKAALKAFKERANKFPTTAPRVASATVKRTTPTSPAPIGKVSPENTLKALRDVASDDPTRAAISGVWSDGKQTVATNGRILTIVKHGLGGTKEEPKVFTTEGKPYVKKTPDEPEFPNWRQVVPPDFKNSLKNLDTEKLFNILTQAKGVTTDRSNSVKVYANKDGTIGLSSGDPEVSSYATNIDPDAKPIFAADPQYIIDALNAARSVGDGKIELAWNDELGAFRIKSKNAESIIMPMRIEGSEQLQREAVKAAQTAKPIPKGPGIVGMGGAVPGEVSQPTIEDQITGNLAPPRPPPAPLETPAQPSTINAIRDSLKTAFDTARGNVDAALNRTFPQTTRIDPRLGELGARWVSSPIAARASAEVFAADVLGHSGVDPVKLGAALTEDNLQSIRNAFEEKADEAENRDEIVSDLQGELENLTDFDEEDPDVRKQKAQLKREISRVSKLTDEDAEKFRAQAGKVKSFIGAEDFPFKTQDDYQNFLDDPKTKEVLERHRSLWQSVIDPQYKAAQQIDPDFELPSRGLQTGARINLRAVQEGEPPLKNTVSTVRRGNLLGTLRRKSPFGVQAKGTGEAYALNYYDLIENTFNKQLEVANRNAFDAALVKAKQAVIAKPGEDVSIGGKKATEFPLRRQKVVFPGGAAAQNQSIYINSRLAPEYRIGANVDQAPPSVLRSLGQVALPALNRAALAGLTDATTHSINLLTALGTLPGGSGKLLQDSILSALPGRPDAFIAIGRAIAKGFGDNRAQEAALAEIGAMKPGQYQTTRNPASWLHSGSDVIRWLDKSVRLALDDSYKRLAQQGIFENSETARREFINQVGQYNKRAQTYYKRFFRDTGLGPFVTAGTTFNNLGVRAALGPLIGPGVRATSVPAALALRANMAAKLAGTVGTIALLNYALTHNKGGGAMGRPGVRLGAIDTGQNDKQGRPLQLDVLSMTGPGRGLRVLGARGFGEAKLNGLPTGTALDAGARDILNSAVAPFAGPAIRFGSVAATGYPPAKDVGRVSPVVPPGQNQTAANLKQALLDANPVVSGLVKAGQPGSTGLTEELKTQLPRLVPQPGKQPAMMKDYPAIVRRAQANAYIEDVIGRARKMAPADRVPFLLDAVKKLESPQDQRKAIREFKYRKVDK